VLDGVRFIRRNEIFYGLIGMTFVNSLFGMSYHVLMPVFARQELLVGPESYGLMQLCAGLGGLGGGLTAAQLARSSGKGRQLFTGALAFGALLVMLSFSPTVAVACGLLFFAGVASQLYMTTTTTVLQLNLPNELRGRVMSIWGLNFSMIPTGGAIAGTVAEAFGSPVAIGLGGAMVILTTLLVATRLPRVRSLA
jgi:MFS family permease